MAHEHGGNIRKLAAAANRPQSALIDFSANINPLGPPEWFRAEMSRTVSALRHYPDPDCTELGQEIARQYDIDIDRIAVGNGSTEIFRFLPEILSAERAVIPVPSYADYLETARQAGVPTITVPLDETADFDLNYDTLLASIKEGDIVYIGRPNNPTGRLADADTLLELAEEKKRATFVIDEAFIDFVADDETLLGRQKRNMIIVRSMTKFFAVPGLRLGYAAAATETAARLRAAMPRWSVNTLAQRFGAEALKDKDYALHTRGLTAEQRDFLTREINDLEGLKACPSAANFLLVKIEQANLTAPQLAARLLEKGIAIRDCENFDGLNDKFFRIAVRTHRENRQLCEALAGILRGRRVRIGKKSAAATLMFQGTSSSAGKSVLTSALCRIMLQDGFRVAPFKAQNMSLNSYVTHDGGEMGRAQVVQAQACRIEPDVRMNPVLLKPNSDIGSQVIVMGRPLGNMRVAEYTRYKSAVREKTAAAFDSLAAEYDAVILEGAGSPAEVNLKHHDIVNMRMADYARSPVLLTGDIDRGGVYGSFVGTMEVLAEWERGLIRGFVVNRFRGDESLLGPAHAYVERHTGVPVLGVVPYIQNFRLPEEDSVEFKSGAYRHSGLKEGNEEMIEIVLIDLPRISNFTDLDALRLEPDVRLQVTDSPADLKKRPDVVIIPGSKNVIGDLEHMQRTGMAEELKRLAEAGKTEIIGVCGGFQMLGREISDPRQVESASGRIRGLGLLPITTVLASEKTLQRVKGMHLDSNLSVHGYEIHHGKTQWRNASPAIRKSDGEVIGVQSENSQVWGTYLHGVFDSDQFRRWLLNRRREIRGLAPRGIIAQYDLESAFDELAAIVRDKLDISAIYEMMGLK